MPKKKRKHLLTQTCVNEPVPHAPSASDQPPPLGAGREAERGAQHADQQVAPRDAHQQEVHGRAQSPVPAEQREHQEVTEEPEGADEAEAHRHHQVPRRAQGRGRESTGHLFVRIRRRRAAGSSPGTVRTAQVGNDHTGLSRRLWTSPKFAPRDGTMRSRGFSLAQPIWRSEGARGSPLLHRARMWQLELQRG